MWSAWEELSRDIKNELLPCWYKQVNQDGSIPSGDTVDTCLLKIRRALYTVALLKKKKAEQQSSATDTSVEVKEDWFPLAWFLFICFGPMPAKPHHQCLRSKPSNGPPLNQQRVDRTQLSRKEQEKKKRKRLRDVLNIDDMEIIDVDIDEPSVAIIQTQLYSKELRMAERAARIAELEKLMNLLPCTDTRYDHAKEEYVNLLYNPHKMQASLSTTPISETSSSTSSFTTPSPGQKNDSDMTPLSTFALPCNVTTSV